MHILLFFSFFLHVASFISYLIMSSSEETKKSPSDELIKSIDLWLQWDQCEATINEIKQLKVKFSISPAPPFFFF
jgi:hypothetical protein